MQCNLSLNVYVARFKAQNYPKLKKKQPTIGDVL